MTRVNLIPVEDLTDQHLMAEYRELKMVPAALRRSLRTKPLEAVLGSVPERYTLNKGHVRFFYNKMFFLIKRYDLIVEELLVRQYKIQHTDSFQDFTEGLPIIFFEHWHPDPDEVAISQERINQKIQMKPNWYRHYGNPLRVS